MWTYEQRTGRLYSDSGVLVGVGYSGKGQGKNNPEMQKIHNVGPLPQGRYKIGKAVDTITHGRLVLPLTPAKENLMWGRYAFLIHGDSVITPGTASEGCMIQAYDVRLMLSNSFDKDLEVIDMLPPPDPDGEISV